MATAFTDYGYKVEYEPAYSVTTLGWFNIAKCARERMTENCTDVKRWRGERRSFYKAITKMNADAVTLLD